MDGIRSACRERIKDAWAEQNAIRNIMMFLHTHGASTSRAVRICKTYGEDAIERAQPDTYCLAKDKHLTCGTRPEDFAA